MSNTLYYGDNLWVMREYIQDESIDLVYLDPPFNSKARYNILFQTPTGKAAAAQAEAFQDTWHWNDQTESAYDEVISMGSSAAEILRALRSFLGTSDMMAYLANMAIRIAELHRVLKSTGSLYLHCDPTASHYLKILLDGIFSGNNFRSEIIWKRSSAHSDTKQGRKQHGRIHDVILYYSKSSDWKWNPVYTPYDDEYIKKFYRHIESETGRRFQLGDITGPGGEAKGNPRYEVMGVTRYWRYSEDKMKELIDQGRIFQSRKGVVPRYKRYLDEMSGSPLQDVWNDINPLGAHAKERLGYPTQKPLSLLDRIISSSSNPEDTILDPFCGCGTTVHASQKLNRKWIGIDVTHYAITLVEDRLKEAFQFIDSEIVGRPKDIEGARDLATRDKFQFQWWANWLVGVQNYREQRRGPDQGIDGLIYFKNGPMGTGRVIVSVKGGEKVGPDMIRSLAGTVDRENAELGLFVTLKEPTTKMKQEAAGLGIVRTAHGKIPKIQISTIEELLEGIKPLLPPAYEASLDERLSKQAKKKDSKQIEFTFSVEGSKTNKRKDEIVYPSERIMATQFSKI